MRSWSTQGCETTKHSRWNFITLISKTRTKAQMKHTQLGNSRRRETGTFLMLSCMSGCMGRAGPTSSRVSIADPGVVAAVLTVVLGAVPDELTESISPATSWISRAKMAKSLAKSWLILRTQGNNLLTIRQGSLGCRIDKYMQQHMQPTVYSV